MTSEVRARKVLVVFPPEYTLQEAYNTVSSWNPDNINWGLVNGRPYVYAKKASKIQQRVKKLSENGVRFYVGENIGKIPTLDNPPLGAPNQQHPNPQHNPQDMRHPDGGVGGVDLQQIIRDIIQPLREGLGNDLEQILKRILIESPQNTSKELSSLRSQLRERESTIADLRNTLGSANKSIIEKTSLIASLNQQIVELNEKLSYNTRNDTLDEEEEEEEENDDTDEEEDVPINKSSSKASSSKASSSKASSKASSNTHWVSILVDQNDMLSEDELYRKVKNDFDSRYADDTGARLAKEYIYNKNKEKVENALMFRLKIYGRNMASYRLNRNKESFNDAIVTAIIDFEKRIP